MIPTPYTPPFPMANGHIQSIYPSLFRRVDDLVYTRERMETSDGDFLDLDWARTRGSSSRLVIISHGLEGCTHRAYVKGMARAFTQEGWDALAWNQRGCSGEPNRLLRMYHNGVTDDLDRVITHGAATGRYKEIALVGFSMGGNLTLLHLGRDKVHPLVKGAVVFSVPCDLSASARALSRKTNAIYMKRFLRMLHEKVKAKALLFPHAVDARGYGEIRDFKAFDDRYTAPIHGFENAEDYWEQCASAPHLKDIPLPCLMVNALNDPFLEPECYPHEAARANPNLTLVTPKSGGHVGFIQFNRQNRYWSEQVAVDFLGTKR